MLRRVVRPRFFPHPPRLPDSRRARSRHPLTLARIRLMTRCSVVNVILLIVITQGVITGVTQLRGRSILYHSVRCVNAGNQTRVSVRRDHLYDVDRDAAG